MTLPSSQIMILLVAVLLYLAGGAAAAAELAGKRVATNKFKWICLIGGTIVGLILLAWHSVNLVQTTGRWQPLQDNLSAMLTLALLLSGFVIYIQLKRPIPSLEWMTMPMVVLLLLMAGHFGKTQPEAYVTSAYSVVHGITTFLGTLAFVFAGVTGAMFLLASRNLKKKPAMGTHLPPRPNVFGSLERLEHLTFSSVTLGFALFTVGVITGIAWAIHTPHGQSRLGEQWYLSPKVLLSFAAWAVFAAVLHTPIAPRLRGRKTAWLSIVGVVLALATLVAVLMMPSGGA